MCDIRSPYRVLSISLLSALCTLLCGCRYVDKSVHNEDVGTTHVAVLSVTRWDDYKAELQPNFALTEQDALRLAMPDTLTQQQSVLDAMSAKIGMSLAPGGVLTDKSGSKDGARASIPQADPIQLPSSSPGRQMGPEWGRVSIDPHLAYLAATALYQEVRLLNRYVADAAISDGYKAYVIRLQISTMPRKRGLPYDTYVDVGFFLDDVPSFSEGSWHSSTTPKSTTAQDLKTPGGPDKPPNVVPAENPKGEQGTKSPESRDDDVTKLYAEAHKLYLDARTNASVSATNAAVAKLEAIVAKLRQSADPKTAQVNELLAQRIEADLRTLRPFLPRIVPLLVTDQVEAAFLSGQTESLQQLSLALAGAYAGIGGRVDMDKIRKAYESSVGRNYNSLFTVGRLSDNILHVRFGARQSPSGNAGFEITTETHNVSLLLLLPSWKVAQEPPAQIHVGIRTEFVNCNNGTEVPHTMDRSKEWWVRKLRQGMSEEELKELNAMGQREIDKLAYHARNGEYDSFVRELNRKQEGQKESLSQPVVANSLWLAMSAEMANASDRTSFTVPVYPDLKPEVIGAEGQEKQTVIMADNGSTVSATILGVKNADPTNISATWEFAYTYKATTPVKPPDKPEDKTEDAVGSYTLAATEAKMAQGGRELLLTFPSPAALGLSPQPMKEKPCTLSVAQRVEDLTDVRLGPFPWRYQSVAKEEPPLAIQCVQDTIQREEDEAKPRELLMNFVLATGPGAIDRKRYRMHVTGGRVKNDDFRSGVLMPVSEELQAFDVIKSGTFTLQLVGLTPDEPVKLTFTAPRGYEAPPSKLITVRELSGTDRNKAPGGDTGAGNRPSTGARGPTGRPEP